MIYISPVTNNVKNTVHTNPIIGILSISKTSKVQSEVVENNLRLLHTTSPSVTLLTSLDAARAYLQSPEGQLNIDKAIDFALYMKEELKNFPKVLVFPLEKENDKSTSLIWLGRIR